MWGGWGRTEHNVDRRHVLRVHIVYHRVDGKVDLGALVRVRHGICVRLVLDGEVAQYGVGLPDLHVAVLESRDLPVRVDS